MKDIEVAVDMLSMKLRKTPGIVSVKSVGRELVVTIRAGSNPTIPVSCGGHIVKMIRQGDAI